MVSYECRVCGYVYDENKEGRKWSELPDDWVCPGCGAPQILVRARRRTQ